ncbi:MAG: HAMP domain-containing histidine kinase [Chloroflexota bacterium]|nr:HAMP domain-containing histidine kinase [Chloroflexota bacterium]
MHRLDRRQPLDRHLAAYQPAAERVGAASPSMTIRLRLTLWYTALLGATLILFSVLVYSALSTNLWLRVQDDAARQAAEVSRALTQQIQWDVVIFPNPANPTRVQLGELNFFASGIGVQFINLNGDVYDRSDNLMRVRTPIPIDALKAIGGGKAWYDYTTLLGETVLIYSVPVWVNKEVRGAVQVIQPVAPVQNTLRQISRYLILGTMFSLVLAAFVGALLARRALAPIDTITQTAGSISHTKDLGRRLTIPNDASEVGQLAATFNRMLDQIQTLFRTQERLIADVSHELRTPLTTVQGNLQLLRRMAGTSSADANPALPTDDVMQELLNEAESEATRMNKMINDLLLLAQADSGALQLQLEPVEMDTLLLEVYRQTKRIADLRRGGAALDIRLGSEDQALVWGDRERLRQVLVNLADNAVKYTSGGTIILSLENSAGWVQISVSDTGIGIPPDQQISIFERFYRTDKARSRELGGSGLGLSIVQWIADAHGGRVTVESQQGQGSTFTLWLPEYRHELAAMQ